MARCLPAPPCAAMASRWVQRPATTATRQALMGAPATAPRSNPAGLVPKTCKARASAATAGTESLRGQRYATAPRRRACLAPRLLQATSAQAQYAPAAQPLRGPPRRRAPRRLAWSGRGALRMAGVCRCRAMCSSTATRRPRCGLSSTLGPRPPTLCHPSRTAQVSSPASRRARRPGAGATAPSPSCSRPASPPSRRLCPTLEPSCRSRPSRVASAST
mmetsp:Transcript_9034/g.22401  ORF Transcript_9034/g.22401 Transcript_9034/m.22401 type:complete len:218 (-) Transcript_9034:1763-2416(-)